MTRTITFPAGTTTQPVRVNTLDDDISELTENFGAQLSNPNGAGLAFSLGSQATATADIRDNDRKLDGLRPVTMQVIVNTEETTGFLNSP